MLSAKENYSTSVASHTSTYIFYSANETSNVKLKTLYLTFHEPLEGIEPSTSSLPRKCSTTEPQRRVIILLTVDRWSLTVKSNLMTVTCHLSCAGDEARTRHL